MNRTFFSGLIMTSLLSLLTGAVAFDGISTSADQHIYSSANLVALGRQLFFDTHLSQDGTVSCSSCHQPAHAFTDGREVSIGSHKRAGTRNAPSLLNIIHGQPLFWDGRRSQLDIAVLDPLTNPVEMANGTLADVTRKLSQRANYRTAFQNIFPGDDAISATHIGAALAAFVRALPQQPSAYDNYQAGNKAALTPQAQEGLRLFQGKADCASCHALTGGRFTDEQFHHSGVSLGDIDLHLGQLTVTALRQNITPNAIGDAVAQDQNLSTMGRFLVSHQAGDVGAFRTPSLRNVALTAPYMHDGSIPTLGVAIDMEIYYRGLSTGRPISLTMDERRDLLVFLQSLSEGSTTSAHRSGKAMEIPR